MSFKEIFYDWGGANLAIFHAINGITNAVYVQFMLLGTTLGKYTLFPEYLIVILLVTYYTTHKKLHYPDYKHYRNQWLQTLAVLILAYLFAWIWTSLLKNNLQMPRPFTALPEGSMHILKEVRKVEKPMVSFPSGHCTFAMTLVASLWPMFNKQWKIAGIFFVTWIGLSRIALGVHFPADVLWTFILAFAAVYLVRKVVYKLWSMTV